MSRTKNTVYPILEAIRKRSLSAYNRFDRRIVTGFTLVELIVVITILVILGTIAFLNIGGFSSSARDGTRISNLSALKKGLDIHQIKAGTYPMPEGSLNILASGSIIGYQWFAKDQIAGLAKLSPGGIEDSSDPTIYTTYSVNASQSKMQIMAFLENGSNATAFAPLLVPTASAGASSDYSARTPVAQGNSLGVLLSTASGNLNQPLQEKVSATFTGIDIVNFTGNLSDGTSASLKAWISPTESVSGTGGALMAIESNMNAKMRLVMYACPSGWKDLGTTGTGNMTIYCTNNGVSFADCRICEADINSVLPTGAIMVTQYWMCNGSALLNTGWATPWGPNGGNCDSDLNSCYMCKSTANSLIPQGVIALMQSCPVSWADIWTPPLTGQPAAGCLYGQSCRLCKKL